MNQESQDIVNPWFSELPHMQADYIERTIFVQDPVDRISLLYAPQPRNLTERKLSFRPPGSDQRRMTPLTVKLTRNGGDCAIFT
jgi:hypothetical protein